MVRAFSVGPPVDCPRGTLAVNEMSMTGDLAPNPIDIILRRSSNNACIDKLAFIKLYVLMFLFTLDIIIFILRLISS